MPFEPDIVTITVSSIGEKGYQGVKGDTGIQGNTGATGATGTKGIAGDTGIQGENGLSSISTDTDTNITGILKGNGSKIEIASGGTDYQAPLSFPLSPSLGGLGTDNGTNVLTVPATGTVALLGTANVFTANQKINVNSTRAFIVEQDGVKDDVLIVDTTNARIGVNRQPVYGVDLLITDGLFRLSNTDADNASKYARMICNSYDIDEEPVYIFGAASISGRNIVGFGGGGAGYNAATEIGFNTAPTNTTLIGSSRMRISSAGLVGIGDNISAATDMTARLHIWGGSDIVQTIIKAHSTQTANILEIQKSDGTVLASVTGGSVANTLVVDTTNGRVGINVTP